jgi:hypothetical protein
MIRYGTGMTEISKSLAQRNGFTLEPEDRPNIPETADLQFFDSRINDLKWKTHKDSTDIGEFFIALSLCHR